MQKIVNMAAAGGVAASASCSMPVIYKPQYRQHEGRARRGGASCAHLNLHLPTAKTNKRLIDVRLGLGQVASTVAAQTATNYVT